MSTTASHSAHHGAPSQPWAGLRVVDEGGLCTAYATRLWAALGAEVVVLEPPGGHPYRQLPPFAPGTGAPEGSLWWAAFGQNKRSVVAAPHSELAAELRRRADVVLVEPDPDERDAVAARRPDNVVVAVTPFGLRGPRATWRGSDLVSWAASGLSYVTGFPDRPPVALAKLNFAAHVTAMNAVGAAMVALRARRQGAGGQLIDVSMQQANAMLSPEAGVPLVLDDGVHRARAGNRRTVSRPFGLYPCADGFVSIIIVQPAHWNNLAAWIAEATGMDAVLEPAFVDLAARWEASDFIDSSTEMLTEPLTKHELFTEGQRRNIPITPVNTVADLAADPHLEQAGFWRDGDHPVVGAHRHPGAPFTGGEGWWHWSRAPMLDEHHDDVCTRWDVPHTLPAS
ncbi:MAG: CaiB/BaiF CoA transferase family protein [Acidimicrobiia bacterium]